MLHEGPARNRPAYFEGFAFTTAIEPALLIVPRPARPARRNHHRTKSTNPLVIRVRPSAQGGSSLSRRPQSQWRKSRRPVVGLSGRCLCVPRVSPRPARRPLSQGMVNLIAGFRPQDCSSGLSRRPAKRSEPAGRRDLENQRGNVVRGIGARVFGADAILEAGLDNQMTLVLTSWQLRS